MAWGEKKLSLDWSRIALGTFVVLAASSNRSICLRVCACMVLGPPFGVSHLPDALPRCCFGGFFFGAGVAWGLTSGTTRHTLSSLPRAGWTGGGSIAGAESLRLSLTSMSERAVVYVYASHIYQGEAALGGGPLSSTCLP